MAVAKISISLEPELLAEARACAEAEGKSLSAWLEEAALDRVRLLGWTRLLDDLEAEHGPPTPEEQARVDAWFDETDRLWADAVKRSRG